MEDWKTIVLRTKFDPKVYYYGFTVRANDRRKLLSDICGSWMRDRQMKLGRDYRVDMIQGHRDVGHDTLVIKFRQPNDALLFKLTWGGTCHDDG